MFSRVVLFSKVMILSLLISAVWARVAVAAQETKPAAPEVQPVGGPAQGTQPATSPAAPQSKFAENAPVITDERLPPGARLYVSPIQNGFETYIIAGLQKKQVPIVVLADRSKADYELSGVSDTDKAGWAKMLFLGSQQTNESASVKVVNLKTGSVVFAYSVNKTNSVRGKQSAGEAVAKHIKEKIENRYH